MPDEKEQKYPWYHYFFPEGLKAEKFFPARYKPYEQEKQPPRLQRPLGYELAEEAWYPSYAQPRKTTGAVTPYYGYPEVTPEMGSWLAQQASLTQNVGNFEEMPLFLQQLQARMAFNSPLRNVDWGTLSLGERKTYAQQLQDAWLQSERGQMPTQQVATEWTPGFYTSKESARQTGELTGWYGAMQGAGLGGAQFGPESIAAETQRQRLNLWRRGQQQELGAMYPQQMAAIQAKIPAGTTFEGSGALGAVDPAMERAGWLAQQPEYKQLQAQYNQSLRYGTGLFGKPAFPQVLWTEYDRYASEEEFPMTFTQWFSNTPEAQSFLNWYQKTEREEEEKRVRVSEMQTRQPRMTPWRAR